MHVATQSDNYVRTVKLCDITARWVLPRTWLASRDPTGSTWQFVNFSYFEFHDESIYMEFFLTWC